MIKLLKWQIFSYVLTHFGFLAVVYLNQAINLQLLLIN